MDRDDSRPLTRDLAPFGVRMPPELKARIHAAAEANNRSMNAEIVATLEKEYPAPPSPDDIRSNHREITIRSIDAVLRQVRANMIKQLDGEAGADLFQGLVNPLDFMKPSPSDD